MPKLLENVLIDGRVRLAGEDISEADATGVRLEVFAPVVSSASNEPVDEAEKQSRRRSPAKK